MVPANGVLVEEHLFVGLIEEELAAVAREDSQKVRQVALEEAFDALLAPHLNERSRDTHSLVLTYVDLSEHF